MNMPYSGFPALPKNIEDMHAQLVALGLNDVEALTARIKKCEDWVDAVEETELTGNPVTFNNALAVPAIDCVTTLSPIQDLHGYDHPWAGGAGKNKYDLHSLIKTSPQAGITFSESNGVMSITGGITSAEFNPMQSYRTVNLAPPLESSTAYIFSIGENKKQADIRLQVFYKETSESSWTQLVSEANVDSINFTTPATFWDLWIRISVSSTFAIATTTLYPMVRLASVIDDTWEPYSNICPISGRTEARVDTENEDGTESAYATIQLGTTVYGGEIDFTEGTAEVTDGYIASYDGETLPSTWISDRDVYAEGTTPTTGAEVVYKLATPIEIDLTPAQLEMLKGYNRVSSDDASSITIKAYTGGPWEAVTRTIKKVTNKTKTTKKRRK